MPRKRVVEQTIYKFEELSDRAKDRVRDWFREGDTDWWEFSYDDFIEVLKRFGFEIQMRSHTIRPYKGPERTVQKPEIYWTQRYGWTAGFCARWRLLDAVNTEKKIKEHAPEDELLHRIAKELDIEVAKFAIVGLEHIIREGDAIMDIKGDEDGIKSDPSIEFFNATTDEFNEAQLQALTALETMVEATAKDLARWFAKQLEREDEYRSSDEAIQESCEANEYEFDEDGCIA